MNRTAVVDFIQRYSSRRLLVFLAATGLLAAGMVTGDQWVTVAGMYLASDAGPKMAAAIGLGRKKTD
jgi:hypothetical protein